MHKGNLINSRKKQCKFKCQQSTNQSKMFVNLTNIRILKTCKTIFDINIYISTFYIFNVNKYYIHFIFNLNQQYYFSTETK